MNEKKKGGTCIVPPTYITTKEAIKYCKDKFDLDVTLPTMISWIHKHKFGNKVGGRWKVDRVKFENQMDIFYASNSCTCE